MLNKYLLVMFSGGNSLPGLVFVVRWPGGWPCLSTRN